MRSYDSKFTHLGRFKKTRPVETALEREQQLIHLSASDIRWLIPSSVASTATWSSWSIWPMNLPVNPPVLPMLAKRVDEIPSKGEWVFEPKWDGFRVLVFRDGGEILLQSRDKKSLNRYFPEMLKPLADQLPTRCALDGELVIAREGRLDFDALQLRIHPAASRVKLLSQQTPASIVFFDLLCQGEHDLSQRPFAERRSALEALLKSSNPPIHITPATRDRKKALGWFRRFEGAGLDGVVAKPVDVFYQPDKRVMLKVKHERDCDCVVARISLVQAERGKRSWFAPARTL